MRIACEAAGPETTVLRRDTRIPVDARTEAAAFRGLDGRAIAVAELRKRAVYRELLRLALAATLVEAPYVNGAMPGAQLPALPPQASEARSARAWTRTCCSNGRRKSIQKKVGKCENQAQAT